ncbi:hypothetical protein [Streptomyces nojiriensis]|uniref:hypothetical protein n=1 Tax=Streptomyces nojiriensis TaxID=66374 RepID=UPI001677D0B2|nr:hypothetical protein [Streptomyces nojiriensis]
MHRACSHAAADDLAATAVLAGAGRLHGTAGTNQPVGHARIPAALPAWPAQELRRTGHLTAPPTPAACAGQSAGVGFTEKLNRAAYTLGGARCRGPLDPPGHRDRLT